MRWLAMLLVLNGSLASADTLIGKWKMTGRECASGAPNRSQSGKIKYDFRATVDIRDKEMDMDLALTLKMNPEDANPLIQQMRDLAASTESQAADSAEKTKYLKELNDTIKQIESYAAGLSCTTEETTSYAFDGHRMQTLKVLKHLSTCPGDTGEDPGTYYSRIEFRKGLLRVIDEQPETDDSTCAKGDHVVTVFSRVKP